MPVQNLEFTDLSAVRKFARFPIWLPEFVPKGLPFYHAYISDYADGSENVRVVYMELGNLPDADIKSLDILMISTDQPVTLDSITHQFRTILIHDRRVQVRAQTGYSYWTASSPAR